MTEFLIVCSIALAGFVFLAVVLYFKDTPRKKTTVISCGCGSTARIQTDCPHCSGQVQILPEIESKD